MRLNFLLLGLLCTLLSACKIDDQRLLTADMRAAVDPAPLALDYASINKNHKVLIGLIDSGVDYRHPQLSKNIHYHLDSTGKLIGIGHDYVANDEMASPYLARTALTSTKADKDRKDDAQKYQLAASRILESAPDLRSILNPLRAYEQEVVATVFHGTHVAGLLSYDQPQIGILPYRVLPENESWSQDDAPDAPYATVFQAIERAVAEGARIINLSIGVLAAKRDDTTPALLAWTEAMGKYMRAHPEVLFVAASGNDGSWIDGRSRLGLPCGISNVDNLLCVSSLDANDQVSDFSNIPLMNVPLVFALGENIVSTLPLDICANFDYQLLKPLAVPTDQEVIDVMAHDFADKVRAKCNTERRDYGILSGTSMSAPLVARLAAIQLMQNPSLSAKDLIQSILASGTHDKIGPLDIIKLKILKPSWYGSQNLWSLFESFRHSGLAPKTDTDYFELKIGAAKP